MAKWDKLKRALASTEKDAPFNTSKTLADLDKMFGTPPDHSFNLDELKRSVPKSIKPEEKSPSPEGYYFPEDEILYEDEDTLAKLKAKRERLNNGLV